jgi:hypothetical protein
VYGFLSEENPTSAIARAAGGHDFAVIDDRFIVDPWLGEFSCPLAELEDCDQQVFDLHCAQDAPPGATTLRLARSLEGNDIPVMQGLHKLIRIYPDASPSGVLLRSGL